MSSDPPNVGGYSYMDSDGNTNFHDPQTFHDRVLLVEGKKFYIQSGLLSVWSEFFRGLFNSDFKEKNAEEIELKELSSDEFELFLRVIYGEYLDIEEIHLELLASLSHRFLAPKVMVVCKRFIDKNFEQMDKPKLLDMACRYDMQDVKKKVLEFVEKYNGFALFAPFAEVAFNHDLEHLDKKIREKDMQFNHFEYHNQRRNNLNVNEQIAPVSMPEAAMEDLKQEFRNMNYVPEVSKGTLWITMEGSVVSELSFKISPYYIDDKTFERTVKNLIFSEAMDLVKFYHPRRISIKNADADELKKFWNSMRATLATKVFKVDANLVGLGDMWDYNIKVVSTILADVVAKMLKQKPGQLYVEVTKTELKISSEYIGSHPENDSSVFQFNFVGAWNLPTSYGNVFPIMLKTALKDIQNLFLIIDLPCKNCIEWIFKHMNWTFDDSTIKHLDGSGQGDDRDSAVVRQYVYAYNHLASWNEFVIEDSQTKVTYFFMKRVADRNQAGVLRLRGC